MARTTGETTSTGEKTSTNAALSSAALAARSCSHHLAGSKLRKQLSGSLQEHVSAPTSTFAKKQLEKMGWSDGTGLGKKRDGITTHIKVKKRKDQEGIGAGKAAADKQASSEQWWKDSLGDTLARLSSKKGKKSDKKKHKRKDYTDEELFEATGGSRFGMRAGITKNLSKWRRSEGDQEETAKVSVEDGTDGDVQGDSKMEVDDLPLDETVNKKDKKDKKSEKKAKKVNKKVKVKLATEEKKKSRKEKKDKKKKKESVGNQSDDDE
jgi:Pin2-interacting protein X1